MLNPASAGEIPVLVASSVGRDFPLIRFAVSRRGTTSTTASFLCQSRKSLGGRPSNFFSPLMALVKLPLSSAKSPVMMEITRKAVLYDTTAVPDAIQRMIQQ